MTCQLAQIYRVFIDDLEDDGIETTLTVHVPRLQKQRGSNDCGCFAIAFAYHMARGDEMENIEFNQGKLRTHLSNCFKNKKLLPFPVLTQIGERQTRRFPAESVNIFCHCKMPEEYGDMIQCDDCNEWYHLKCVGINTSVAGNWTCKHCNSS